MTLSQASASLRLSATVDPADPLSSGTYELGGGSSLYSFPDANQVYTGKVSNLDSTGDINIKTATANLPVGTVISGLGGEDADGAAVDLSEIYGLKIKNLGADDLAVEVSSWTGSNPMVEFGNVPPGGELIVVDPAGRPITLCSLDFAPGGQDGAFEIAVIGKTSA